MDRRLKQRMIIETHLREALRSGQLGLLADTNIPDTEGSKPFETAATQVSPGARPSCSLVFSHVSSKQFGDFFRICRLDEVVVKPGLLPTVLVA